MSNEAICTSANGRDIITEIREPLGSGIDHAREAVAILAFLSASVYTRTLLRHILLTQSHFRPAMWTRRKCRVVEKTLHNQFTGGHCSGQEYCRPAVLLWMRIGADKIADETE